MRQPIFKDPEMPVIKVDDEVIECRLVLFDLDGTLVDKDFRNRSLAEARMNAIRRLVGEDAAQRGRRCQALTRPRSTWTSGGRSRRRLGGRT